MKRFALALLAMALTTPAHASLVAAGCAPTPSAATRTVYVDPAKGNDANPGTAAAPLKTLQPGSIKPGDAWILATGRYGDVKLDGIKLPAFAMIAAAPGATPRFDTLEVIGSSHLIVSHIKVMSQATADQGYTPLVNITGYPAMGASTDIVLDSNKLSSIDSSDKWTQADWRAKGRWYAINVDGGDARSTYARCVSLTSNTIRNIKYGIGATADDMLVDNNTIQNYGDDGIDFAANRILIHGNRLLDNRDIGDANHNDGMQGQIGHGIGGTTVYDGVTIDGNVVIAKQTPGLAFPGDLQGISAFNMDWSNIKAINNVVVTNAFHGISFYSAHNGLIANNVVIGTDPTISTWIDVEDKSHEGSSSNNVVVRNNITYMVSLGTAAAVADHNLISYMLSWQLNGGQFLKTAGIYGDHNQVDPAAFSKVFRKIDIAGASYDFHIKPGSEAYGTGNSAAPLDANGKLRLNVSLGAY